MKDDQLYNDKLKILKVEKMIVNDGGVMMLNKNQLKMKENVLN